MNKLKTFGTWALPAALTLIAIVWAVVAIGGTLTAIAHPAFAYSTAVLYDAVWLYGLAMETAHRRQGTSARLPKVIGWLFLPMTVAVLAVHGLLAADVLAAIVGALVPVLAKMTLIMAIDRDTTRISPRAQAAIDRARSVTRDRIAVSRAMAEARAHNTKVAAELLSRVRKAEAEAVTTVRRSESYMEIVDQGAELPGLISDREMEDLLSGDQARRSTTPRATHHRDPLTVREKEALRNARKQRKALAAGHDDAFVEVVPGLGRLSPAATPTTSHAPIVYFLRNGNRIKIGTSTNLRERVGSLSLRMRDVVLIVEGGRDTERAFHQHFARQRVRNTEWFAFSGAVNNWVRAARHRLHLAEWQSPAEAECESAPIPHARGEITEGEADSGAVGSDQQEHTDVPAGSHNGQAADTGPSATPNVVDADSEENAPETAAEERPSPPVRKPAIDDDDLYRAGFDLYRSLTPPRSQNKFVAVMRERGHSASDKRLIAVYKRVEAEISDMSIDAITSNSDAEGGETS
jgi:hypothetical protein